MGALQGGDGSISTGAADDSELDNAGKSDADARLGHDKKDSRESSKEEAKAWATVAKDGKKKNGGTREEPRSALACSQKSGKGHERVVAYIDTVVKKLEGSSGAPSQKELQKKVMPSVVASLKELLEKQAASVRDGCIEVLQECKVLPNFEADCATFKQALERCAELAKKSGSVADPSGQNEQSVSFVVKNTFVDTAEDDDVSPMGTKVPGRSRSEPSGGVTGPPLGHEEQEAEFGGSCGSQASPSTEPVKVRANSGVEDTNIFQRTESVGSVKRVEADVSAQNMAGIKTVGKPWDEKALPSCWPVDAPKYIIRNTFVTEADDDDDDGPALTDYRSLSDPTTGGLREWHDRLKQELPSKAAVKPDTTETPLITPTASRVVDIGVRPVTFVDREGDKTTLLAGKVVGTLELDINGESHDAVNLLELEYVDEGQYCVYMQGMGAVVVDPPPGPKQHEFCQDLMKLATACGVPVTNRSALPAGNALEPLDQSMMRPAGMPVLGMDGVQGFDAAGFHQDFSGWNQMQWGFNYAAAGYNDGENKEDEGADSTAIPQPVFGWTHHFHTEVATMGSVQENYRQFTKVGFEGRLSVISESQVHSGGQHRFLVQFTSGDLSKADGVGFIFSPRLPCKKNIQRIVSIFVNQRGTICMRVFHDVIRASAHVKALKLGDWVELFMDLDNCVAYFSIWPMSLNVEGQKRPMSHAEFAFAHKITNFYKDSGNEERPDLDLRTGHLACVVKNVGVTVTVGS